MLRIASGLAVSIVALMLAPSESGAAPRHPGGFRPAVPMKFAGGWQGRRQIGPVKRFGFHQGKGRRFVAGGFYPGYPFAFDNGATVVRERGDDEPERMVDRDSFENIPASTGIPRAPVGNPVIYRIEGTKARPTIRALRVGIEDRRAGHRHLASAEGGDAELLTIKPR